MSRTGAPIGSIARSLAVDGQPSLDPVGDPAGCPNVSVIVLNFDGALLLERCLSSVMQQTDVPFELIVVDNGSSDRSLALVEEQFPDARIIALPENRGVAAGYNAGLRAARGRLLVVLNNDTAVCSGWLRALVDAAGSDRRIGSVASLLCRADAPGVIDSAGICVDITGSAWDQFGGEPRSRVGTSPREVFGACAGAALYTRAMLDDVGLFDPDFFAYLEDVDLAWRARLRGWQTLLQPNAVVLHVHSATAREGSPFKLWHLGRNRVWLLFRTYPAPFCWYALPLIVAYDVMASLYALLVRRDLHALRGRVRGLGTLHRQISHRASIQRRRSVAWSALRPLLQPLEAPWAIRKRYAYLSAPVAHPDEVGQPPVRSRG